MLLVLLLTFLSLAPIVSGSETLDLGNTQPQSIGEEKELVLLHGEHVIVLEAKENVSTFNLRYYFPPEYGYQIPILMEILDDTTAKIISYKIENDTNEPNKVVNFTIESLNTTELGRIHLNYWVLVENYDYSDLPSRITIPKKENLPSNVTKWLSATEVVQKDHFRIRLRARQMKFLTNDVLRLANRIARFSMKHRFGLFLIQYYLGLYGPQDALTTLKRNGECPGRSHLGCALFRANNVPARVLIANPSYDFWYEAHYLTEYYSGQEYGWILTEVHHAITPYEPKNQIIMRICYPEDENNDTHTDYLYPRMTGVENYIWINNESVEPYYKDLNEGSKTRMINENEITVDSFDANITIGITKEAYSNFEYYTNMDLTGENLDYFNSAVSYQKTAVNILKNDVDPFGYYTYMHLANLEYDKISI